MGCTLSKSLSSLVRGGSGGTSPNPGRPSPGPWNPPASRCSSDCSRRRGDLLDLFEKFQALRTKESQRESMELAQHASVVMTTLDEGINALDNLDYFMDYLHNTGRLHFKIKGFKKEYFWHIENPFLAAVSETLGDRYTENIENIYKITIRFILETLVEGFEMAEKEAAA
ncbi:hypothetical protein MTO96_030598 [Rhipicephalus appendiculatus]